MRPSGPKIGLSPEFVDFRSVEDLRGHAVNDLRPVGRAHVRSQTDAWRAATVASALVCILLIACLLLGTGHASIAAHVIEVMR